MPEIPHVRTGEQIAGLPEFGSNSQGWFYGLVATTIDGEECLVIAEILPGFGYTFVDRTEIEPNAWRMILDDLQRQIPPSLSATMPPTARGESHQSGGDPA